MKHYFLFVALLSFNLCSAQKEVTGDDVKYNFFGVSISYGFNNPAGDLADRFGRHNEAGVGMEYHIPNKNLIIFSEAKLMFGDKVREQPIGNLLTASGNILGSDSRYASVFLRMRGHYWGVGIAKTILTDNIGKGLRLDASLGLLSHYIRVQDDSKSVPQVSGNYLKGYDRLTRGPALKQRIGYNYVNSSRKVFLSIAFEITEAFTKGKRPLNFDTGTTDNSARLDLIYGLNVKYTLPLKSFAPAGEIYY